MTKPYPTRFKWRSNTIAPSASTARKSVKWNAAIGDCPPREREVMELVVSGLLNKQIAGELRTSDFTIKVHRAHVMKKMQAGSLADLVKISEKLRLQRGCQLP